MCRSKPSRFNRRADSFRDQLLARSTGAECHIFLAYLECVWREPSPYVRLRGVESKWITSKRKSFVRRKRLQKWRKRSASRRWQFGVLDEKLRRSSRIERRSSPPSLSAWSTKCSRWRRVGICSRTEFRLRSHINHARIEETFALDADAGIASAKVAGQPPLRAMCWTVEGRRSS